MFHVSALIYHPVQPRRTGQEFKSQGEAIISFLMTIRFFEFPPLKINSWCFSELFLCGIHDSIFGTFSVLGGDEDMATN